MLSNMEGILDDSISAKPKETLQVNITKSPDPIKSGDNAPQSQLLGTYTHLAVKRDQPSVTLKHLQDKQVPSESTIECYSFQQCMAVPQCGPHGDSQATEPPCKFKDRVKCVPSPMSHNCQQNAKVGFIGLKWMDSFHCNQCLKALSVNTYVLISGYYLNL